MWSTLVCWKCHGPPGAAVPALRKLPLSALCRDVAHQPLLLLGLWIPPPSGALLYPWVNVMKKSQ